MEMTCPSAITLLILSERYDSDALNEKLDLVRRKRRTWEIKRRSSGYEDENGIEERLGGNEGIKGMEWKGMEGRKEGRNDESDGIW